MSDSIIELADSNNERLEVVIREKTTKRVIFKGDIKTYCLHRPMYGFRHMGELQHDKLVAGPYLNIQITVKNPESKAYKDALNEYEIAEFMG